MKLVRPFALFSALVLLLWSCVAPYAAPTRTAGAGASQGRPVAASVGGSEARSVSASEANWKERIEVPYVYVERVGDYRSLGESMRGLMASLEAARVTASGPPFALFYDDPGTTPITELRARACLPVRGRPSVLPPGVRYEVLPRAMVAYRRVNGPYSELPRTYGELFAFLRKLGWKQDGPVREVYLVNPGSVQSYDELLAEVQVPWAPGR